MFSVTNKLQNDILLLLLLSVFFYFACLVAAAWWCESCARRGLSEVDNIKRTYTEFISTCENWKIMLCVATRERIKGGWSVVVEHMIHMGTFASAVFEAGWCFVAPPHSATDTLTHTHTHTQESKRNGRGAQVRPKARRGRVYSEWIYARKRDKRANDERRCRVTDVTNSLKWRDLAARFCCARTRECHYILYIVRSQCGAHALTSQTSHGI